MEFINHFLTLIERELTYIKRYPIREFIYEFAIAPIIWALGLLFQGLFIEKVNFYGVKIPFLYLVFIAYSYPLFQSYLIPAILEELTERPENIILFNKKAWFLSQLILSLTRTLFSMLVSFLPLYFLINFPTNLLLFSYIIAFLSSFFILAIGFLFSSIAILLKDDTYPFMWGLNFMAYVLFPIYYSLTIFPRALRKLIEILIPPFGIIEEIRKLIFLGSLDIKIIFLSLLASLVYAIILGLIFLKILKNAQKSGKILLK